MSQSAPWRASASRTPDLLPPSAGMGRGLWTEGRGVEGGAHIPSIPGALSVQGSVVSMPAPRGVSQAQVSEA